MHFMLILQHHKQYFLSHRGMNQWWLSGIPPLFPAAGTRHPGFSCHRGRVLEGAVLSDYFEWDCSVLYYSCGRTHAHDPATHLALVPMQPAVSEGLIKQFRSSGPSPSIALVFFFFLFLHPSSSQSHYTTASDWVEGGEKKEKRPKNVKSLLLTSTLRTSTSWGARSRATAPCQAPCQPLSASFQKKNHPLSLECSRAPIDSHHHTDRNYVKMYVHSIQQRVAESKAKDTGLSARQRHTDIWIDG